MKVNKNYAGLALGFLFAIMHAVWALLVAIGWAQGIMDFVFRIHLLNNPFIIQSFSWGNSILLVIVTFVIGYIIGWIFGWLWNMLHKNSN